MSRPFFERNPMSQITTYRMRFATRMPASEIAEKMIEMGRLPLSSPRSAGFSGMDFRALVGEKLSFSDHIPDEDLEAPYWSYDGTVVTIAVDLTNPQYRDDDSDFCEVGEPSRQTTLIDIATSICQAEEGEIIGAWQGEYSEDWHPLVYIGGKIRRAFVQGYYNLRWDEQPAQFRGKILPEHLEDDDGKSVTIKKTAFQ